jgi:hypothetical protein
MQDEFRTYQLGKNSNPAALGLEWCVEACKLLKSAF